MNILKAYYEKQKEKNFQKQVSYFGTAYFHKLKTNPIPVLFILAFYFCILLGSIPYVSYLGDFLFWFVSILEITKVLKIPFLDEIRYYHYLSLFVYIYLLFALLLDISKLLRGLSKEVYLVQKEIWILEQVSFGKKLRKLQIGQEPFSYEHSGLLDILGLNRFRWKISTEDTISSPFFFPTGMNKTFIGKILGR